MRLAIVFIALAASAAGAQSVPLVSVDLAAGSARTTASTPQTYYSHEKPSFVRGAVALRLGTAAHLRPIVTLEASSQCPPGIGCGHAAVCAIAPNGRCEEWFPDLEGVAASLGVARTLGGRGLVELSGGVASYLKPAKYLDANIAYRVLGHVSLVADARYLVGQDLHGDRVWLFPISYGLRIH